MLTIRPNDLTAPAVRALLALHLHGMHQNSPPGTDYALDLSGLQTPDITVYTAWFADRLAGMAALKILAPGHAELKSMRTHPEYLRRGVARALLLRLIAEARSRAITRLSLETGSGPAFEPALALYRRHGFTEGEIFGAYLASDFNRFLHLRL